MSRQPRPDVARVPQHVVQRGNDRQPCFFTEADYFRYLVDLRDAALRYEVAVHAYVLMTNHVHLLVTPTAVGGVSRLMQFLGRHYVPYVNATYRRTGTLWEGRYKSCLVGSGRYLLTCYRYIELNPIRAGMVECPGEYRWSSYRSNALGEADPLLSPHAQYTTLGATQEERLAAYQRLVDDAIDETQIREIRSYLQQQRAWGSERFQLAIAAQLGRCAQTRPAHRPRKSEAPP
jgi:putative transposase